MKFCIKIIQSFAENRIFELHWKYNQLFGVETQKRMSMETLDLVVYEDEPWCTSLDGKCFKVIGIDDKVRAKCKSHAQKFSVISGTFQIMI